MQCVCQPIYVSPRAECHPDGESLRRIFQRSPEPEDFTPASGRFAALEAAKPDSSSAAVETINLKNLTRPVSVQTYFRS